MVGEVEPVVNSAPQAHFTWASGYHLGWPLVFTALVFYHRLQERDADHCLDRAAGRGTFRSAGQFSVKCRNAATGMNVGPVYEHEAVSTSRRRGPVEPSSDRAR